MPIDSALGRLGIKQGLCTSSTRPANPFEGQVIYESDTNRTLVYDNAAWVVVADSQVLSIDATNSRVGIGTTSPSTTLHVDGSILANDSVTIGDGGEYVAGSIYSDANWGMIFRAKQASPAVADFRWANSADTERMRLDANGNLGIGMSGGGYRVEVNGDINATGDVRVGGVAINGNLVTGSTSYFTNNAQYAPEYGSNYYRTNLYTVAAPSGKSISSVQLTVVANGTYAPAWVTLTAISSSQYSYYVYSKGASSGNVQYFLDCR